MKKLFKYTLLLLLIVLLAGAGFVYTFDANKYKTEISQIIEDIVNRPVTISGDVAISVYPWIGVKLNEVTIENTQGFSKAEFATIGQFDINVKLLPLLQKHLDVDKFVLHQLSLAFERNAAGEDNWSDFSGDGSGESFESKFGLAGLVIGGVEISEADFSWYDVTTGKRFELSKISLTTDKVVKGKPLAIDLKAYIASNQPEWQSAVSVETNLEFTDDALVFNANDIKLKAKAVFPGSKLDKLSFAMVSDGVINLHNNKAKLNKTKFSLFGLIMSGSFDVDNIFSVPVIEGPLAVKKFSAEKLAKYFKFDVPAMANEQSLKNIALKASFKTDFSQFYLDDLYANVDQSRINGFVHVAVGEQSVVRYDLKVDRLALNDYQSADQSANDEIMLPLDLIRSTELEGTLDIENITLDDIEITQFHTDSQINNGTVKANPITMWIGDSELKAAMLLDARSTPLGKFTVAVNNVDAKASVNPLLETVLGNGDLSLDGLANFDINIKTKGTSISEQKSLATGTVKVSMAKTVVHGIDLNHASRTVVADYANKNNFRTRQSYVPEYQPDLETVFNSLNATFKVAGGKLINKDLLLVSDAANITGSGSIDFINGKLDYRHVLDIKVKNRVDIRDKLRDYPMEYHALGNFRNIQTTFEQAKYELLVGRLLVQESKASRYKQMNTEKKKLW